MITPLFSGLAGIDPQALLPPAQFARAGQALLGQYAGVQQLDAAVASDQTSLSVLGQARSALAEFQAVAASVAGAGLETGATSSNAKVASAVTVNGAVAGEHTLEVQQLAQGQVLDSAAQASANGAIGSGAASTVRIEFGTTSGSNFTPGGKAVSIHIDASNNSLAGIAKALQDAGIDAAVTKAGNGYALRLRGEEGAGNSVRIAVGGDQALQRLLAYNPAGAQHLVQRSAAQDAQLSVDGKHVTSASNVVTGAVDGVALVLAGTGSAKVGVSQSASQIGANIAQFAQAYNRLNASLHGLGNDPALAQVRNALAQVLAPGTQSQLARVGIRTAANGDLEINAAALDAAVGADAGAVSRLLTDHGRGLADQFGARIGQLLGANGSLDQRATTLGRELSSLSAKQGALRSVLGQQNGGLLGQYTAQSATSALPGLAADSAVSYPLPGLAVYSAAANPLPGLSGPTSLLDLLA